MKLIMENWRKYINEDYFHRKATKARGGAVDGWIFGTVEGKVLDFSNKDKMFYGASIPKPMLALVNMITRGGTSKELTDKELRGLINYVGYGPLDSNAINKRLTRDISAREATEFLRKIGIGGDKPKSKIRYGWGGQNYQTPQEYFNFLSLLLNIDSRVQSSPKQWKLMSSAEKFLVLYQDKVRKILRTMKREQFPRDSGSGAPDREMGGILHLQQYLEREKGFSIKTIYGKGGKAAGSLNYGLVIDDKYILVIYTDYSNVGDALTGTDPEKATSRYRMLKTVAKIIDKNAPEYRVSGGERQVISRMINLRDAKNRIITMHRTTAPTNELIIFFAGKCRKCESSRKKPAKINEWIFKKNDYLLVVNYDTDIESIKAIIESERKKAPELSIKVVGHSQGGESAIKYSSELGAQKLVLLDPAVPWKWENYSLPASVEIYAGSCHMAKFKSRQEALAEKIGTKVKNPGKCVNLARKSKKTRRIYENTYFKKHMKFFYDFFG